MPSTKCIGKIGEMAKKKKSSVRAFFIIHEAAGVKIHALSVSSNQDPPFVLPMPKKIRIIKSVLACAADSNVPYIKNAKPAQDKKRRLFSAVYSNFCRPRMSSIGSALNERRR